MSSIKSYASDKNQTASNIAQAMRKRLIPAEDKGLPIPVDIPQSDTDSSQPSETLTILEAMLPDLRTAAIEHIENGFLDDFLRSIIIEVANAGAVNSWMIELIIYKWAED